MGGSPTLSLCALAGSKTEEMTAELKTLKGKEQMCLLYSAGDGHPPEINSLPERLKVWQQERQVFLVALSSWMANRVSMISQPMSWWNRQNFIDG